jgi:hypothetical protein
MEKYFLNPMFLLGAITWVLLLSGKFLNNQSLLIAGKYLMYFMAIIAIPVLTTLIFLGCIAHLKSKK